MFSNQLDCQNAFQAIFASPELYFGFIDCVKAFSRAPNHEERVKKLIQLYQNINAYMFCPSSNLSVYRKCQRLVLEEVVLNQAFQLTPLNSAKKLESKWGSHWGQMSLVLQMSGFCVHIENAINQILSNCTDYAQWCAWLSQKKPSNVAPQEFQAKVKDYYYGSNQARSQQYQSPHTLSTNYCKQMQANYADLSATLQPLHFPINELWEFVHWQLTQNAFKYTRLSHVSQLTMQMVMMSSVLSSEQLEKERRKTSGQFIDDPEFDQMRKLKLMLRCLMLSSDLASSMYIKFVSDVFSKMNTENVIEDES